MAERRDTCATCSAFAPDQGDEEYGQCRRRSPAHGHWPTVTASGWCLEHVPAHVTRKTLVNPVVRK